MESNKIKLLILWDILCKYTDEEHAMNTDEIIAALKEKGISVIRKVVAEDIKTLNDYGYEVLSYKKRYHYYYVVNRPFDIAEIVMLTDVVKSSKLTDKRKKDITEKLCGTLGNHQAENIRKSVVSFSDDKKGNTSILYNIDKIERAINENKQISFKYFDYNAKHDKVYRKNGKRYVSNPLAMVWDKDNYYLLSFNNGHSEPVTYRLDKIDSVEIESNEREFHSEYSDFDSERYRKIVFSMYSGEIKNVTLAFGEEMITSIFDKFGEKVEIKENSGTYEATVTIQPSKPFFLWVTGTLGKVKITEPEEVVKRFNDFENAIKENY